MTADIIAFGAPRAPAQPQLEEPATQGRPHAYGALAKGAALGLLQGALKAIVFAVYVVLFWTRGIIRLVLGLVGGISLLMLIVAFFMPHDYEHRTTALTVFAALGIGATVLRIVFDRLLYQVTPEGSTLG